MNALKIAGQIFLNGRIDDPDDWDEMEIELNFELDERGVKGEERKQALKTVKDRWYK